MTRRRIAFRVIGVPQAQGSAQPFLTWHGKHPQARVRHDNPKLKGWRQVVAEQAQGVIGDELFTGPVVLTVVFRLPRPDGLPKRTLHHVKQPDLDKLVRAIGDGLTNVVFVDDKQIVDLHARKVYTSGAQPPSAWIVVEAADLPDSEQTLDLFADASVFDQKREGEFA